MFFEEECLAFFGVLLVYLPVSTPLSIGGFFLCEKLHFFRLRRKFLYLCRGLSGMDLLFCVAGPTNYELRRQPFFTITLQESL